MRTVFMILYFFFIRALPLKFRVKEGKITMYLISAFFALLFVKITFLLMIHSISQILSIKSNSLPAKGVL